VSSAQDTQVQENPSSIDHVDAERVLERIVQPVPGIFDCLVVTDTQDTEVHAQVEQSVGSFGDFAQPVLLIHWTPSALALCLI